jgi:hypothetical protein
MFMDFKSFKQKISIKLVISDGCIGLTDDDGDKRYPQDGAFAPSAKVKMLTPGSSGGYPAKIHRDTRIRGINREARQGKPVL